MIEAFKDTILQMNEKGKQGQPFLFLINFNLDEVRVFDPEDLIGEDIWVSVPGFSNMADDSNTGIFTFEKHPVDFGHYTQAFEKVMAAINRGDTFLLNLTFPTQLNTDLTLGQIFQLGRAPYRLKYKDEFVVFSPETFITIKDTSIATFPMKGTIDAAIPNAEQKLLHDVKEISEHNTIVDLLRNDLNRVSKRVKVDKFRYIDRIRTHERELMQTSSRISGVLPPDWRGRIGEILLELLPAGSISGAPKRKTLEVIREAEGYDRGWFTGVFGFFDGSGLDSAVMIRYVEKQNEKLVFKSGGGITHFSDCRHEYNELTEKVYLPFH